MILTCPHCATRYQTEAANFPVAGRKVRCAKCGHLWHQSPPEAEPVQATPSVPKDPPAPPQDMSAIRAMLRDQIAHTGESHVQSFRPLAERLGLAAGWAGLVAMLLLVAWVGFRFRQEIASLWPQSSALYATFGVAVNSRGIEFDDVSYRRESSNGQSVLAVTGKLVNVSQRELPVPPVRVTLTDDDQRELYHWNFRPPQPTLKPGETLSFLTRLSGPPPSAKHLQLHFASQD